MKSFTRCACADGVKDGGRAGGGGALRLPWVVVGSHNFSKAAWGELSTDGRTLLGCKACYPNPNPDPNPDPNPNPNQDLRPWLLEVNHNPSLTCDTPFDHALKSGEG